MRISNSTLTICCPLCGANKISKRGHLKYSGNVYFSTISIELTHIPELWKCQQCLSNFVQNTVDADTAKNLYSNADAGDRWLTEAFERSKTPDLLRCMAEIFKERASVLDVGCNTGELLDFARSHGCKTTGVEFSSKSREILDRKGHTAYPELEDVPGKFDVITAFDLVEHLYDISGFIQNCRSKLNSNGCLVILTGNSKSLSATLAGLRWWYLQYPEHIIFQSKKFFENYSGLRVKKLIKTYAFRSHQYSIYRMTWRTIKGFLRRRTYTGMPSLGADHILAVLSR